MNLHAAGGEGGEPGLERIGCLHHPVGALGGAGLHDRGMAVARDRDAWSWRNDAADRIVRAQCRLDPGDSALEGRIVDRPGRRVDHRHQPVARQSAEVLVDQLPSLHRLRPGRLPARTRERGLNPRGEEPESDRDDQPADEHHPEMCGGVAADAADRPDVRRMRVLLLDRGLSPSRGFSSDVSIDACPTHPSSRRVSHVHGERRNRGTRQCGQRLLVLITRPSVRRSCRCSLRRSDRALRPAGRRRSRRPRGDRLAVAEHHQRRDRPDAVPAGQCGLSVDIDLREAVLRA